jgi:hypothetical protein
MTDAREEIEQRLNFLLPQAERTLNERGAFYPGGILPVVASVRSQTAAAASCG